MESHLEVKEEPADSADEPRGVKLEMDIGPTELQPIDVYYVLPLIKPKPGKRGDNEAQLRRPDPPTDTGRSVADEDASCSIGATRDRDRRSPGRTQTGPKETSSFGNKYKVYECSICSERFRKKRIFSQHFRIHIGEPYRCPICELQFKKKSTLSTHLRTHTAKKLCECAYCYKRLQKSHLSQDLRINTGKKSYEFTYC